MKQKEKLGKKNSFNFFYELGKVIIPGRIRPRLRDYLLKAGIEEVPYSAIGVIFLSALLISSLYVVYSVVPSLEEVRMPGINRPLTFFESLGLILINRVVLHNFLKVFGSLFFSLGATVLLVFILLYVFFEYRIYVRTVSMEKALPDFLRQVSQNLKAGLTLDKALWNSIDPSFKELSFEIRLLAKRVMVGEDLDSALFSFGRKYKSPELLRTFSLIAESNKTGSEMAYIVDRVIESLEQNKSLKEEIRATNTSYTLFISIIVVGIIPLLFSLAYNLMTVLEKLTGKFKGMGNIEGANLPLNLANLNLTFDPTLTYYFIFGAVLVSSFTASLLISIINNGDLRATPKYLLIYSTLSVITFQIVFKFVTGFFTGLFATL